MISMILNIIASTANWFQNQNRVIKITINHYCFPVSVKQRKTIL